MTEKATFGERSDLNWRREGNHFAHPLCARPPSAQVCFMASAVVVSQAKPLGVVAQRWWTLGRWSGLSPTHSGLAMKHFLCWLKQLLCDPNKIGAGVRPESLSEEECRPHYWVRLSSLGHKASLEFGRWSNFRSH